MFKEIKFYHNKNLDQKFPKYNLLYVSGIPNIIAKEDILKSDQFFGHYVRNKSSQRNEFSKIQDTCQVYITYERIESTCIAILALDNSVLNTQKIKAYFGITKLCWHVFQKRKCKDTNCQFVHYFDDVIFNQSTKMKRNKLIRFFLALEKSQSFIVDNIQHQFVNIFLPSKKISLWKIFNYTKNNCPKYYKELLSQISQHRTQNDKDLQNFNIAQTSVSQSNSFDSVKDIMDKENNQSVFLKKIKGEHNPPISLFKRFEFKTLNKPQFNFYQVIIINQYNVKFQSQ